MRHVRRHCSDASKRKRVRVHAFICIFGGVTPGALQLSLGRVIGAHIVRKACRRLRETSAANLWCGLGLTTSVVLLSILEYYAYSISPGQAAAHGGHAMLSGGHVVLLNNHVPYTHTTTLPLGCLLGSGGM